MIRHSCYFASLGMIAAGAILLAAAPAAAVPVPYTPSTSLAPLQISSGTFTIDQIHDGQTAPDLRNGFASDASTGDILFTFAGPTDLTGFALWDNIIVDQTGGIVSFSLEFFDSNNASLGPPTHYTAVPTQALPMQIALSQQGVRRVRMHIDSSQFRIEIREVAFDGQRTKPNSFTTACNEVSGLGFALTTMTVMRSSSPVDRSAIVIPTSYPYGPLRPYNDNHFDRIFVDSFLLIPDTRRVCQIVVRVRGSSDYVGNNDRAAIFLPKHNGIILDGVTGWNSTVGSVLLPTRLLTNYVSYWTYSLTVSSAVASMRPALADALATGPNFLDVVVQDDSLVMDVSVTYTLY